MMEFLNRQNLQPSPLIFVDLAYTRIIVQILHSKFGISKIYKGLEAMEDLKTVMNEHMDLMADLVDKFSGELRSGLKPAYENFMGFFHAIDWKEPWLISLMGFHALLLIVTFMSRKNVNFQMCFFLLALAGVYLAERLNKVLAQNWKSFASQNYFDPQGVFLSVLWSGPLLVISIIILVNTLFNLCQLMVRWKRAELRHRSRVSRTKEE